MILSYPGVKYLELCDKTLSSLYLDLKENPCVFEMKYMAKKFMKGNTTADDSYFICKKLMYVTVLFMYLPT